MNQTLLPIKISERVHWVGAIDWDRRLFDSLIPLPDGTSYNAYVVRGTQKTALIDTVDPPMTEVLLSRLEHLGIEDVDWVISHHAEQDHSGALPQVLARYPKAQVVATPKAKAMLMDLLRLPEDRFLTVEDGQTLSLGDCTLEFIHAPWVHWPETMLTYLRDERTLFPCDLFGSHLASSDLYATDETRVYDAAKRYYAEIMMPFAAHIRRHLAKLDDYPIDLIAPSHGPIYNRPALILDAYREWVDGEPKNLVALCYISMHGSTKVMVERLVDSLMTRGVAVERFNLEAVDLGKLAMVLVDAATIVIASPTVLLGPHPNVAYAAVLANALRPKAKFAAVIGSYGWGGKMVDQLAGLLSNLKLEMLQPVIARGLPTDEDLQALDRLADAIAAKHRTLSAG